LPQLRDAADRALFDSRRAIAALSSWTAQPLETDLTKATEDVAQPADLQVKVAMGDALGGLDSSGRERLIRIAREAVANAIRHGQAKHVTVEVSSDGLSHLCVQDDGIGFDSNDPECSTGGFGLLSMRESAASIGASFSVRSFPGRGTTVEVAWR
ncbi:MAG: sensor histidine kinase, partial [Acidimicrobiales bacterium]